MVRQSALSVFGRRCYLHARRSGASIVQVRQVQYHPYSRTADLLTLLRVWSLNTPLLAFGWLYYLNGYWGWAAGVATIGVLCGLLIRILETSSRVGLVLGYSVFIAIILVLARGCAYIEVSLP